MTSAQFDRRQVIALASLGLGSLALSAMADADDQNTRPPSLPAEKVKDFVIAGHGDLDKVKAMLDAEPGLLNATWDWGGGDFESAIGGAGHMGRADIAENLLSKGARMDVFVAAMLGKLDVVKATLTAYPNLKSSAGPHGIPLMAHAKQGGEKAKSVVEYLESLG